MAKKIKINKYEIVFVVGLALVLGIALGMELSMTLITTKTTSNLQTTEILQTGSLKSIPGESTVELGIPAVDQSGNGVAGKLITTVRPGKGRILFDIKNVLNREDVQDSGRIAAAVAAKYTGIDINTIDVIYVVEVNASQIEGPSAGSSMAVSVILALENKTANSSIMMTGTIEEDGTIGNVGAIPEKARAALQAGATAFLVPAGQGSTADVKKVKNCETKLTQDGTPYEFCQIKYDQQKKSIGNTLGIDVYEVANLTEALKYFG